MAQDEDAPEIAADGPLTYEGYKQMIYDIFLLDQTITQAQAARDALDKKAKRYFEAESLGDTPVKRPSLKASSAETDVPPQPGKRPGYELARTVRMEQVVNSDPDHDFMPEDVHEALPDIELKYIRDQLLRLAREKRILRTAHGYRSIKGALRDPQSLFGAVASNGAHPPATISEVNREEGLHPDFTSANGREVGDAQ